MIGPYLDRAWGIARTPPTHSASAADLRTIELAGLVLPVRATIAAAVVTLAALFDYSFATNVLDLTAVESRSEGSCS